MPQKQEKSKGKKQRGSKRRPWREEEDEAIKNILESCSSAKWSSIAEQLKTMFNIFGRTGKQCRERWHNHLSPGVSKSPWRLEEELALFEIHKTIGNRWAEISNTLRGRSDNSIKNRFYTTLKRHFRKLNGFDATQKELKKKENELCSTVLSNLYRKDRKRKQASFVWARDAFFDDFKSNELDPPGFPELFPIEISEFVVTGQKIEAPVGAVQFVNTDNWCTSEVFVLCNEHKGI